MYVDDICADASVPGAIPFDYNGQTWYFDPASILAEVKAAIASGLVI